MPEQYNIRLYYIWKNEVPIAPQHSYVRISCSFLRNNQQKYRYFSVVNTGGFAADNISYFCVSFGLSSKNRSCQWNRFHWKPLNRWNLLWQVNNFRFLLLDYWASDWNNVDKWTVGNISGCQLHSGGHPQLMHLQLKRSEICSFFTVFTTTNVFANAIVVIALPAIE